MRVLRIARGGRTKWLPQAISTRVCRLGDVCLNLLFFFARCLFFFRFSQCLCSCWALTLNRAAPFVSRAASHFLSISWSFPCLVRRQCSDTCGKFICERDFLSQLLPPLLLSRADSNHDVDICHHQQQVDYLLSAWRWHGRILNGRQPFLFDSPARSQRIESNRWPAWCAATECSPANIAFVPSSWLIQEVPEAAYVHRTATGQDESRCQYRNAKFSSSAPLQFGQISKQVGKFHHITSHDKSPPRKQRTMSSTAQWPHQNLLQSECNTIKFGPPLIQHSTRKARPTENDRNTFHYSSASYWSDKKFAFSRCKF